MMWNRRTLGECGLASADLHAAVNLHRVGVDDFAIESLSELDREC
jgi:hypothetical protein